MPLASECTVYMTKEWSQILNNSTISHLGLSENTEEKAWFGKSKHNMLFTWFISNLGIPTYLGQWRNISVHVNVLIVPCWQTRMCESVGDLSRMTISVTNNDIPFCVTWWRTSSAERGSPPDTQTPRVCSVWHLFLPPLTQLIPSNSSTCQFPTIQSALVGVEHIVWSHWQACQELIVSSGSRKS